MSTFNSTADHFETIQSKLGLDMQLQHSFLEPDESNAGKSFNVRGEDFGSTSSESTSTVSSVRPISTTVSSTGDQSMFHPTSNSKLWNQTFLHPQHFMQPAGSQLYQSVIYDQQQHGYKYTPSPYGISSLGYAPDTVPSMPMSIPMSQPMQQHQVVYPVHESRPVLENWLHVPVSPAAFAQQKPETWQGPSVVPSTVSTPVVSFGSPGYVNTYGYIKTPLLWSAPCTPIPSSLTCLEVPPALDLDKSRTTSCGYPQKISCQINLGSVSSVPEARPVTVGAMPAEPERKKQAASGNSSYQQALQKVEETGATREGVNLWTGSLNYEEYQLNGGSNLFITWSGAKEALAAKLQSFKLKVREVLSTRDNNICNVIFESHPIARKAFTMQQRIRLRILPPKNSCRMWFRNPSPTFLVKFETKYRLTLRKGKAECHDVVGELQKGCLITADQLKGNRIRVISCVGSFVLPTGNTFEMKGGVQTHSGERVSLGWISYRSKYTNETLVIRRSCNNLRDYIYNN